MKAGKWLLWLVLVDFSLLTLWAMWEVGYLGIWQAGFSSPGGMQILADLTVCCGLIALWIWNDAKQRGVNPWPWIVATIFVGSLSPLVYLLVRESGKVNANLAMS